MAHYAEAESDIRSPTPDSVSLGDWRHVARLERSAEELSQGGSDIGEEIRKLKRQEDSRRSSIVSHSNSIPAIYTRNRGASASSYSNSIRDARYPGYSSAASLQSGNMTMSLPEPVQEGRPLDSPLTSPLVPQTHVDTNSQSFNSAELATTTHEDLQKDADKERPNSSTASQQADHLFQDFDGIHFSPIHEEFVAEDEQGNIVGRIPLQDAIQQTPPRRSSMAFKPPTDDMVFYPAPVPRVLNLPKRLSTRPSSYVLPKRQSQATLAQPRSKTRNTLSIPPMDFELLKEEESNVTANNDEEDPAAIRQRSSMASLHHNNINRASRMPPQLRASVFFDRPTERQSVLLQGGSATATLESILKASATAPVNVYTDHPIAGRDVGNIFAQERTARRATMPAPLVSDARNTLYRSSALSGDGHELGDDPQRTRRASVVSMLTDLRNPEGKKLQKRSSKLSIGSQDALKAEGDHHESPALDIFLQRETQPDAGEGLEQDDDADLDNADMGPVYAQPTTLLAELQLRKAQQKLRSRTAAIAFPDGMHATLLEMDAVAQIESKKRKNHKVALAWEDPVAQAAAEDTNEELPLGVLFPTKTGAARNKVSEGEWDRPLGLMERRQLEDSEPLSSRRNRLLGIDTRTQVEDPDEHLTLAERRRQIKQKAALDEALGEVNRESKSSFGLEVMSELGMPEAKTEDSVEETLGERRARLHREKSQTQQQPDPAATRPVLRQSTSLSNVLGAVPASTRPGGIRPRAVSSYVSSSLLAEHDTVAAQQKARMSQHNLGRSSYQDTRNFPSRLPSQMFDEPNPVLIDNNEQIPGLIAAAGGGVTSRRSSGHIAASASMSSLNALQSKIQAGFAQQGQVMNPLAFTDFVPPAPKTGLGFSGGMAAGDVQYGNSLLGQGSGYGMVQGNFNHRDKIERWRSSVAR